jgi:translocation and assembly module TamB
MSEPTSEAGAVPERRRWRKRRVFLALVAGWLLLVGAVAGFAAWTFATERGTRWALGRFLPDGITVERVEGRLAGPLALHGLDSRSEGADVRVERLDLRWQPGRLWSRTLLVDTLEIRGIEVRQKPTEPTDPEPFDLEEFRFPLGMAVEIRRLLLADLRIHAVEAAEPTVLEEVVVAATGSGSEIRLHDLGVRAPAYRLRALGDLATRDAFPLNLDLRWEAELPEQPPLAGEGRLEGELLGELRLAHDLRLPTPARLTARITDPLRALAWCAEVSVPRFALRTVRDDLDAYHAGGDFAACGDAETVTGDGTFAALLDGIGEVTGGVRLGYGGDRLRVESLDVRLPAAGRLSARGDVSLADSLPAFRVQGEWRNLGWPLAGAPEFASPDGRFEVTGTPARYRIAADAAVAGSAAPAGRWSLRGRGTPTGLELERVDGRTLEGRITGRGTVGWGEQVAWAIVVGAERLNPGAWLPDLPGLLGVEIATRGTLRDGRLRADVRLGRLDGVLRGVPLDLRSDVALDGDRYTVRSLELRSGTASVRAAGAVGAEWSLGWEADAPSLAEFAELAPGLEGSLFARGTLSGPRERPHVTAGVVADGVAVGETAVRQVTATVALDLADREPSDVRLRLDGVRAGVELEELELIGGGSHGDHALTLTARTATDTLAATLAGGVEGEGWSGALERLDLHTAQLGRWGLRSPAPIRASADSARLAGLCWGSGEAEACLDGEWSATGGRRGAVDVSRIPLALLRPWLPEDATLDGEVTLAGRGEMDADGAVRAAARLGIGPGAIRFGPEGEGQPGRAWEALVADLALDEREMRADFALRLADGDSVGGYLHVPQDVPAEEQILTGRIEGELHDRGLLGLLLDDVAGSDGVLRIDLQPGGTVAEPRIGGRITVADGRMELLPLGVRLRDVTLEAASDGAPTWTLLGGAASGEGRMDLAGTLRLPDAAGGAEAWGAEVEVRGERFEAFNTPLARVIATPELSIRATPERIDLTGEVRIPRASITPAALEPVVPASEDVVIVSADGEEPAEPAPVVAIHTRVRVALGDSVQLDAFGLRGRLRGAIEVADEPGSVTTGRGEVQIVDGTFERFRQRLAIDRGRLIFAGGPIDNPGVDVRVTRRTRDVLAGMTVEGTATTPRVTLFSEPGMAEADVLAYLLLGRPASLASEAEGEFLQNAASSAGLAGGRMLAGRLGSTLGLQDARIEGENLQQASLFLGTYLSPRLYVGYGIGLFDTVSLLRIRYRLGKAWVVQTESGAETGADLLYTIER